LQFATNLKRSIAGQYVAGGASDRGVAFFEFERGLRSRLTEIVLSAPSMSNTIARTMSSGVWKYTSEQGSAVHPELLSGP
jgi:hypothetical protein